MNQNYDNVEHIIIDGGSTDNTVDVIKKYEKHLTYWISEKDSGQADAINKGFRKATGDIITWINSDDMLAEGALNRIAELFGNSAENIGLIHGNTILFNDDKTNKVSKGFPNPTIEKYISGIAFAQPSSFIRKKYWDVIGELHTEYHFGMDYDLFAKLTLICDFKKVDETFSHYRLHQTSKSISQNELFINDWIAVFANVLRNLNKQKYISVMEKLEISQSVLGNEKYKFYYNEPKMNWELAFYYFLANVVRSDYQHNKFARAKTIIKYLNEEYKELLTADKETKKIVIRLKLLPESIISSYRSLKK